MKLPVINMPKKKFFSLILLLILPVVIIFLSLYFKSAKGEYYIFRYFDPSYAYLANGLNLAQLNGSSVGHIDHPGTTVQVICAIVIRIVHALNFQNEDLVQSVFKNPEYYLNYINMAFVFMIAFTLLILGFVIYRLFGNIYAALIFQLSPFFSVIKSYSLTNVSSEPLLIFITLVFISVTMCYVNEGEITKSKNLKYIIGFGIICGFGLVTKVLFFPLVVIPVLLIRKISNKILFIAFTTIAFLIFVFPAISYDNSIRFFMWIKDLILHSGEYGYGEENFVDKAKFINNFRKILVYEPSFTVPYLLTGIIILLQFFKKYRDTIRSNKYFILLIGIFITMTIQISIVSKQFALYYMLPVMILSVMTLFIVNSVIKDIFPRFYKSRNYLYLSLVLIILLIYSAKADYNQIATYRYYNAQCETTLNFIESKYKGTPVVSCYKTSSPVNAIYYGVSYSGFVKDKYDSVLVSIYPDYFFFNTKGNEFRYFNISFVRDKIINYDKLIFQSMDENGILGFVSIIKKITDKQNIQYKNVFTNDAGEMVYEVTLQN